MLPSDATTSEDRARAQVMATVARVWARSKDQVIGRVATLEHAIMSLLEGDLEEAARHEAEREAHKLAGLLTTFGFPEASHLAREIELTFLGSNLLGQSHALRLFQQVLALRQELEQAPTP